MPSYTSSLRLIQPTTGEYPGTWGSQVNTGLTALVDNAVAGTATIAVGSTDYTLSTVNGAADESRAAVLSLTAGAGVGARNIICPAVSKLYTVVNSSGFTQTVKTAAGTGVAVPTGTTAFVRCDGTNVVTALNYFGSLTLGAALPTSSGGTGSTSTTYCSLTANVTGTLPVANGGTGVTSSTGTGSVVLSTSPTLVTPLLGTPTSGTLTNCTGLPVSTGVSGLGSGVATFLATPTSANLAAAVTGETGSGALVFATSPTLVTPALGTPSSGTLTNCTGLPLNTGVSGVLSVPNGGTGVTSSTGTGSVVLSNSPSFITPNLGTPASGNLSACTSYLASNLSGLGANVATFLGTPTSANLAAAVTDETGSGALVFATSPTLVTPALGTPTSGTLTSCTGLPLSTGVTGTLPVANGGTGAATAQAAINSLAGATTSGQYLRGNGTNVVMSAIQAADVPTLNQNTTGTAANVTGIVAVANGGTGVTTSTGSGSVVLSTSPALVTPVLGTPSSGTLTSCTGLPISTGVSGLGTGVATALAVNTGLSGAFVVNGGALGTPSSGTATNLTGLPLTTGVTGILPVANGGTGITSFGTGVATWLGTPSSANLAAAVTDETGSGSLVFATSPTLVTPVLGTPTSVTLTNATGLPLTTGVTGTLPLANGGTGQTTAQAAINSLAGAVTSGQYLRGNGTNVVMSAIQAADVPTLNQNTTGTAANVTGTVAVANGGTGVTTSTGSGSVVLSTSPALTTPNLGTPSAATLTNATGLPLTTGVTGTLGTANGGTGLTAFTANQIFYASSTSAVAQSAGLTFNGTNFATTGTSTGTKFIPTGGTAADNGMYLPSANTLAFSTVNVQRAQITSTGYLKVSNSGTYQYSATSTHEFNNNASGTAAGSFYASNAAYLGSVVTADTTRAANPNFILFDGLANGIQQFYVTGDGEIYAQNTTVQSLSDGRLKENIRNATEGLSVITSLRPVRYDWKPGYGNDRKNQLGFIAQEVEAVFPDAVSTWKSSDDPADPYKTVGPGALIPVLVKAIQEQQALIENLRARVAALEAA